MRRDLAGVTVVKTALPVQGAGGSIPCRGAKILHAEWYSQSKMGHVAKRAEGTLGRRWAATFDSRGKDIYPCVVSTLPHHPSYFSFFSHHPSYSSPPDLLKWARNCSSVLDRLL